MGGFESVPMGIPQGIPQGFPQGIPLERYVPAPPQPQQYYYESVPTPTPSRRIIEHTPSRSASSSSRGSSRPVEAKDAEAYLKKPKHSLSTATGTNIRWYSDGIMAGAVSLVGADGSETHYSCVRNSGLKDKMGKVKSPVMDYADGEKPKLPKKKVVKKDTKKAKRGLAAGPVHTVGRMEGGEAMYYPDPDSSLDPDKSGKGIRVTTDSSGSVAYEKYDGTPNGSANLEAITAEELPSWFKN